MYAQSEAACVISEDGAIMAESIDTLVCSATIAGMACNMSAARHRMTIDSLDMEYRPYFLLK